MTAEDDPGDELDEDNEWAARLRRRAEQLRADPVPVQRSTEDAAPEQDAQPGEAGHGDDDAEDDDEAEPFAAGTIGGVDDPDLSELLQKWETEAHEESGSPHRNWSPLVAVAVVVAVVAIVALAFGVVLADDDPDDAGGPAGERGEASSVLDDELPSLDELTADVTIPPGPAEGLSIADKGVTVVEDRFDPARREGTFAVIIENPHERWTAQGVQVDVQFLDAAGTPLGGDNGFVEVVLPGQKVAVAALFFDAPTVPVADLSVTLDVARWRETDAVDGTFQTTDVVTEEAEFSGVHSTFVLRSTFEDDLVDVGVTVVYRGPDGRIVGGSDTFVDLLEPHTDTPVEVSLLANITIDQVAITEVYPSASFGFVPDE